jgi:hypothetical protein
MLSSDWDITTVIVLLNRILYNRVTIFSSLQLDDWISGIRDALMDGISAMMLPSDWI